MNILAIGAHPDDVDYGCCGTIVKHIKCGDTVYHLVLTHGERGIPCTDKRKRIKEAIKSASITGINKLYSPALEDTNIKYDYYTINEIERIVNENKIDIVYTHTNKDTHQDHYNTYLSTLSACRKVKNLFAYEGPSTMLNFSPNCFVDIKETLSIKIKAIKCYKTQNNKKYMDNNLVENLARIRGYQAKLKYAEAFEVVRMIK